MLVIFEGVDKVGKSTIIKKFNQQTNFKYCTIDRMFVSTIAYDVIYNRNIVDKNKLINEFKKIKDFIVIVYLFDEENSIIQRLRQFNHEEINVERDLKIFNEIISELEKEGFHVLRINSFKHGIEKTIDIINNFIEEVEK